MNKLFGWFVLLLSLAFLGDGAFALSESAGKVENLWVCPTAADLFIVEQISENNQPLLRIGRRHGSQLTWDQRNGKAKSVVPFDKALCLAYEDGMIIQDGGQSPPIILGKLPDQMTPERLFADQSQNRLLVLARRGKTISTAPSSVWQIYELISGNWKLLPSLPGELGIASGPMLLADNGRLDLFGITGQSELRHWIYQNKNWVKQPVITLDVNIHQYWPLSLDGFSCLVVSVAEGKDEQLFVYHLLAAGAVKKIGPLMVDKGKLALRTKYAVTAQADHILAGYLSEDQTQVKLARWSKDGELTGKVENISQAISSKGQDHSILFTLFMISILLMVFFTFRRPGSINLELPAGMVFSQGWRRGLAFGLDLLLVSFVVVFLMWIFWYDQMRLWMENAAATNFFDSGQVDQRMYVISWINSAAYAGYCMIMEGLFGWTIGKWMFRLEVRQARRTGDRPTWVQVFLRNIVKILELQFWPLLFILFLNRNRQRIGDMLAGTIVLQTQNKND
ncbi:MAG: RDD family protein [Phycisphaerae bacterium]